MTAFYRRGEETTNTGAVNPEAKEARVMDPEANAEAATVPDREVAIETPWRRSRRLQECPIDPRAIETRGLKLEG